MKLVVDIKKQLGRFCLCTAFTTEDLITGLLGASGCGKSMTLKCIAGIEVPDSGYIEFDGTVLFDSKRKINLKPQKRRVGYLFQNYALFPTMSVKKNIMCGLHFQKDKTKREKEYRKVISLLHLEELQNHKPWQLSGGQAQRVALARMLVNNPKLLLFDEPFSALDSYLRKNLQTELVEILNIVKKQAIVVTHSQKEVKKMCTGMFIMKDGQIIQGGKTLDVFSNPKNRDCAVLLED